MMRHFLLVQSLENGRISISTINLENVKRFPQFLRSSGRIHKAFNPAYIALRIINGTQMVNINLFHIFSRDVVLNS